MNQDHKKSRLWKRTLCVLTALVMMLPISNLWALNVVISGTDGQQELADGDTLTVLSSGAVEAEATDDNINAVIGDTVTGTDSGGNDIFAIVNATVTVENGGEISASSKTTTFVGTSSNGIHVKAIEAEDGTEIENAGKISATVVDEYDNSAHAFAIQVRSKDAETGDVVINNLSDGVISATATSTYEAIARGIHTEEEISGLDINNAGKIYATATGTDEESNASGIKVGQNSTGAITNNGTIQAIAESDGDSQAKGLWIGENDADPSTDFINVINADDARISAKSTSNMENNGSAFGIQAGGSIIKLLTNKGAITAFASGGDETKAIGVKAEESWELKNYGTVFANLDANYDGKIDNSQAIGVFAANMDSDSEFKFTNFEGAIILVESTYNSTGGIDNGAGSYGARLSDDGARIIINKGFIKAVTEMSSVGEFDYNVGAYGIRSGSSTAADDSLTIDNSGTIHAIATELKSEDHIEENVGAFGIRSGQTSNGGSTTITNNGGGIIYAQASLIAPEAQENSGAFGMRIGDDNAYAGGDIYNVNVTNDGKITALATVDVDSVTGNGNNGAFGIRTGTAKIVNTGDITANATMNGTNDSTNDGAYGIRTGDGAATVVHSGTINATLVDNDTSTLQRAAGIMTGQGENIIHLSGSVTAEADNDEAYAIIMGCEDSGGSDNTLVIMEGTSLTGDVLNEGDGVAEVILGAAKDANGLGIEGQSDSSFNFTYDGSFIGTSGWNALLVGGTMAGNIVIEGDYTQSSGATYRALLGDGADVELEVSGTATFNNDSVIEIGTAGYVADKSIHTIVQAGTLAPADAAAQEALLSESSLVLDYSLYDDGDANTIAVSAARVPYAELGVSSNALGAGNALIAMATGGIAEANSYIGLVDNCSTADCINEGYGALAPEQYPSLLDLSQAGNAAFGSVISGRMGNLHIVRGKQDLQYATNIITENGPVNSRLPAFDRRAEGWSSWARILGMHGNQDNDGAFQGWDYDTLGISFGADNKVSQNTAVGFGLGYAATEAEFDNNSQSSDMDSLYASAYGTYSVDNYYVDGALTFAANSYDSLRAIPLANLNASSSTDGMELGIMVGGGYNLIDTESMFFIPTASVRWGKLDIDGFTESGAGAFNLNVDDYDADSFISTIGFRLGRPAGEHSKVEPELRIAWAHEFGDNDREATASFAGQSEKFTIKAVEPEEDSVVIGLGLNYYEEDNMTFYIDYDGEYRNGYDAHSVSAGFRYDY